MDKISNLLYNISLGYIFAFPILLLLLKLNSLKEFEIRGRNVISVLLSIATMSILNVTNTVLNDGEFASNFVMIWGFIIAPMAIGFFIFLNGIDPGEKESSKKRKAVLGFKKRTVILLAVSILVAFSVVLNFTIRSCDTVLNYHQNLVNKIATANNPKELLYEETSNSVYMFDAIITDINQISNSRAYVSLALPWRVEVTVETYDRTRYWVMDYVRRDKEWRLEGTSGRGEVVSTGGLRE